MRKKQKSEKESDLEFIHSGSHILNLAVSGKINGGWAKGRIINIVGDGSSGKTLLALEACFQMYKHNKKNVEIIYDNVEGVMDFPLKNMFGDDFIDRINWIHSSDIETFGKTFHNKVKQLEGDDELLYILDSLDALPSKAGRDRVENQLKKKDDKEEKGGYRMEKPKYLSSDFFNTLCKDIKNKSATLIIISQVRDKINAGLFEKKQYRTGGKALDFYTHQVCWLAVIKKLTKVIRGKKKVYGVKVKAKVERNKISNPFEEAEFDILFNYGIDDIGSMIDYKLQGESISFKDREVMINEYEENNEKVKELIEEIEKMWNEDKEKATVKRKRRF